MKHWPTCRCAECLKIHFSLGEKASDFRARTILGELLYITQIRAWSNELKIAVKVEYASQIALTK